MMTDSVSKWMKNLKAQVDINDPIWKAWRLMKEFDVKVLPVISGERIVGLVTDKDIVRSSDHNGGQNMSTKAAMNLDPLVVKQDLKVVDVVHAMILKDQQDAIIIDEKNSVVGVFSWSEAFHYFLGQMNLPISQQRRFK